MMKRFSEIQKKSRVLKRINESESNLPENYEDMSKEELIKLMSGQSKSEETEEKEEQIQTEEKVEDIENEDVETLDIAEDQNININTNTNTNTNANKKKRKGKKK